MKNILKYLTVIISLSLMFGGEGNAKVRELSYEQLNWGRIITVCVDGYKFIYTKNSTVQMFEEKNGKSVPSKCN